MMVLEYNEESSKRLLALYTTPDIEAQRQEFINEIKLQSGEKVLDVGSGPGFLARAIKEKVGTQGLVYGVDVSEFMLNIAKSKSDEKHEIIFSYGDATGHGMKAGLMVATFKSLFSALGKKLEITEFLKKPTIS